MFSADNMVQIVLGNEVIRNESANGSVLFTEARKTDNSDFFRENFIFSNRYRVCQL